MDRILKINLFKEQPQRVNKKKYEKVNNNVKTPQVKSTEINNIPQEIKTVKLKHSYDIYKKTANFTILNVRLENVNMKIEVFYMIDCANQQKCEVKELQDNCLLQKSYEFNFAHVDRHALEDEFTVQLSFSVQENIISRVLRRKYKFDVS